MALTANEVNTILKIIDMAMRYGIPITQTLINDIGENEVTMEKLESLEIEEDPRQMFDKYVNKYK